MKTKAIEINGLLIGSGMPKVCVPIMGKDTEALLHEISQAKAEEPDLVEWRADYFERLNEEAALLEALRAVREALGETPLIFTIRTKAEGGQAELSEEAYGEGILAAAKSGLAELIDVEVFSHKQVNALIEKIRETGAKVIASAHDFQKTDDSEILKKRFFDMDDSGADILKMAVMPRTFDDVAALMQVTHEVASEYTDKPLISMAMGNLGSMSRIAGENFGSSVTFACVGAASAPGQFPIGELRMMMDALHKKNTE